MGSSQFQVPSSVRQEWLPFTSNGKQFAKNIITEEVFQFKILDAHQQDSISSLIQRSIYSIPKTPKVIMLSDQFNEFFALIQQGYGTLAQQLPKIRSYFEVLQIVRNMVNVIQLLYKKYGAFIIKQEMISISRNLDVMIWINQAKEKCQVQLPLEFSFKNQQQMLENLLRIVQNYTHFNVYHLFQGHEKKFSAFYTIITQFINRSFNLSHLTERSRSKIKRVLTPQHPRTHRNDIKTRNLLFDNQSLALESSLKLQKALQVPNFIRGMKDKKTSLLDSLDHRRTITRQEYASVKDINRAKPHIEPNAKIQKSQIYQVQSLKITPQVHNDFYFSKKFSASSSAKTCQCLTSSDESGKRYIKRIPLNGKSISNQVKMHHTIQNPITDFHKDKIFGQQCESIRINELNQIPDKLQLDNLCSNFAESKCFQNGQLKISFALKQENDAESKEPADNAIHMHHPKCIHFLSNQSPELSEQFKKVIDF